MEDKEQQPGARPAPDGQDGSPDSALRETSAARLLDERQDQLLLTLGHELKTPITVIKGTVQLAHHRLRAAGHLQEAAWMAVANSQIDRLTALVDYLLRAGQLDGSAVRLDLARVNLTALVQEVALTLQALSDAHVVTVEAPEDVEVEGDGDRLRQVMSNLINNAIKYSPAGGNVEITMRRTGGEVAFCVRDYGIGIPIEDRERVFERFERASNVGHIPGFGLGLTMCRNIIHAHHGRLWVGALSEEAAAAAITSGPPPAGDARGSIFCLALPVSQRSRR
jgi:signal transduction histidine kinase